MLCPDQAESNWVAGFARIWSVRKFTAVWRLQLPLGPQILVRDKSLAPAKQNLALTSREQPPIPETLTESDPSGSGAPSSGGKGLSVWWLIPFPLLLAIFLLVSSAQREGPMGGQESPSIGEPAPQFDLVSLTSDLSLPPYQWQPGHVTLLHFWGTWCAPCQLEYPELSMMAGRLRFDEQPFDFVPVTCAYGSGERLEDLWTKTHDYLKSNRIDTAAYADPSGVTRRSAAERLQRPSLFYPTSVLIDHQGKIAGVWEGYTPDSVEQIRMLADRLIADSRD
jgi:cytochrome c biogenesis protein CcmG/thiol:disulfide interchange protein DsbE